MEFGFFQLCNVLLKKASLWMLFIANFFLFKMSKSFFSLVTFKKAFVRLNGVLYNSAFAKNNNRILLFFINASANIELGLEVKISSEQSINCDEVNESSSKILHLTGNMSLGLFLVMILNLLVLLNFSINLSIVFYSLL